MNRNTFWHYVTLFLTVFTILLIPTYWYYYGPQNFLWISDIGLFLTAIALWSQSQLVMSVAAVGVLGFELFWNIDFFAQLLFHMQLTGLSDYMFKIEYPFFLRLFSLFHIVVPVLWILYLAQYGYDKRALVYFAPLYWVSILATYWFTTPGENINWVFWPFVHGIQAISPQVWVFMLAVSMPLLLFLPTHVALKKLFIKYRDNS